MKFRKTEIGDLASLTKELQRSLNLYEALMPTVCGIGTMLCFTRYGWPMAQKVSEMGELRDEFISTIMVACVLWGLFYNYRKLSKKVVAVYEKVYHETLTLKGCPNWLIMLTVVVMLLLLLKKEAYRPILIATVFVVGWAFVVTLELCIFPIAMMIDQFSESGGQTRGKNDTTQVEVIEPEWYVRQKKARENPTISKSPQKHSYVPSGKINVDASMQTDRITVVIEMKEEKPGK